MPGPRFLKISAFLYFVVLVVWAHPEPGSIKDHTQPVLTDNRGTQRNFRTFLPKPGEVIEDPASQLVQILLDRQDQGEFTSYMVQVLFRGRPASRNFKVLDNRIVIDFYDTGKPATRLSKIRGGAIEASLLEELFYQEPRVSTGKSGTDKTARHLKRMVRLTLYINKKTLDLKFRDTLDRTLIHFRLPKTLEIRP